MTDSAPTTSEHPAEHSIGIWRRNPLAPALLGCALVCLVPLLSFRFPPMTDYANHYVRLWLLTGGGAETNLASIYKVDWNVAWINVGVDAVATLLGHVLPMVFLGPFILALCLLLAPLGAILLNRKIFGSLHWWNILCLMLAWNSVFLFGFLSYTLSLGLALVFAGADFGLRNRSFLLAFAARALMASVLLLAHPFGLLFYAALLAALTFGAKLDAVAGKAAILRSLRNITIAVFPTFIPLAAIALFSAPLPGDHSISVFTSMIWNPFTIGRAISTLLTYFQTYSLALDSGFIFLMAFVVLVSAREGTLEVHWGLIIAAVGLALLSLAAPVEMLQTGGIDKRFPCMMALALSAGLRPNLSKTQAGQGALLAIAVAAVVLRTAIIEFIWDERNKDVLAVEQVLQRVPAGAAILPAQNELTEANVGNAPLGRVVGNTFASFWHYPALAILERRAFMPYLFTAPGKQPVKVLPPWNEIAVAEGRPVPVDMLAVRDTGVPFMHDWQHRFDYVLVLNADMPNPDGPMPSFSFLKLVEDAGFAQLWKIDRS